jgi:hypothetical protein
MKKIMALLCMVVISNAQACFYGETKDDYEGSIAIAYEKFDEICSSSCFPISPACERAHIVCFEKELAALESHYDCHESSILVATAARTCLTKTIPLSIDR